MSINTETKNNIKKLINVFEMGSKDIKYSQLYIYSDGPGGKRQITLSFGITEYGNMKRLLQLYVANGGKYASQFNPFISKVGATALVDNATFKSLLIESSRNDPVMRECQDKIYDVVYWDKAYNWFLEGGFKEKLSMAVIMDSFIHSGTILSFLRNKFTTKLPAAGGSEKEWIKNYCQTRKFWLANHGRKILRNTVYRMNFFLSEIEKSEWDFSCPITTQGVKVC